MKLTRRAFWNSTFAAAACAIALPLFSGCGNNASTTDSATPAATTGGPSGEKIKLGFIVKQPDEPWFQLEWKFADDAAKKDGFELLKIGALDGTKTMTAIDNLAANGAKGFVICPADTKLGPAIMAKAKSKNMKVIAVDDQFLASDGKPMTEVPYLEIGRAHV